MSGSANGRNPVGGRAGSSIPTDETSAELAVLCDTHGNRAESLIEILHSVQARFGHVPPQAATALASALNLSRAEVHGVISFYHDFHTAPHGRHVLKMCRAEACQAVGAEALLDHVCATLGIEPGGTTADGALTVEPAYCLGNCALGPAALADGKLMARLTRERVDGLVSAARADAAITQAAE
jgi:formate dehydrogenase subunit gamma